MLGLDAIVHAVSPSPSVLWCPVSVTHSCVVPAGNVMRGEGQVPSGANWGACAWVREHSCRSARVHGSCTGPVLQTLSVSRVSAQQSVLFALRLIPPFPPSPLWNVGADPHRLGLLVSHVSWLFLASEMHWRQGLGRKGETGVFLTLPLCLGQWRLPVAEISLQGPQLLQGRPTRVPAFTGWP